MDAAAEARLIERARKGDLRAFGELVDAHQPSVRAFLRRLTGNAADADDVAQEAFARTWEVLHRFDGASTLRTFIRGVGENFKQRQRYRVWLLAARTRSRPQPHSAAPSRMLHKRRQ